MFLFSPALLKISLIVFIDFIFVNRYGLPPLKEIPGGFSPLLELYGKAKNRQPLLVELLFPSDWVVTLPNIDVNGEEGTIQVGQYSAGDTATLYVWKEAGEVEVSCHLYTKY